MQTAFKRAIYATRYDQHSTPQLQAVDIIEKMPSKKMLCGRVAVDRRSASLASCSICWAADEEDDAELRRNSSLITDGSVIHRWGEDSHRCDTHGPRPRTNYTGSRKSKLKWETEKNSVLLHYFGFRRVEPRRFSDIQHGKFLPRGLACHHEGIVFIHRALEMRRDIAGVYRETSHNWPDRIFN